MIQVTYLQRNCYSNYVFLEHMYITLKGIEKSLFAWVLRIFLIRKFLNFTVVFTKKAQIFFSLHTIFHVRKLILIYSTDMTIHSFWKPRLSYHILPVISKSHIQRNSKQIIFLNIVNFLCLYNCILSWGRDQRRVIGSESSPVHMGCSRARNGSF